MGGWRDLAACSGYDTDLFFDHRRQKEAREVCARCPVMAECLDYAMTTKWQGYPTAGIWGGTGKMQRRGMKRRRSNGEES